ncbi:MAG: hypothetical protein EAZ84_13670 [Verrucomicrobia bacterium]|nr:MAG: hypothetical protein EAZ84_13670 [Verrucomicrobiota bacterium]
MNKIELTTARGTAVYPSLNKPSTKFDADGVYECKLRFASDDAFVDTFRAKAQQAIDAKYDEVVAELVKAGKKGVADKITKANPPIAIEEDDATGEETGYVTIKAKKKASGISQKTGNPWRSKPDIFDARGVQIGGNDRKFDESKLPSIGGGSVMKMNVELRGYYIAKDKEVGCSVYLNGVQIIKLVSFGSRDASGYGFGAEEDGDAIDLAEDMADDVDTGGDDDEDDI